MYGSIILMARDAPAGRAVRTDRRVIPNAYLPAPAFLDTIALASFPTIRGFLKQACRIEHVAGERLDPLSQIFSEVR